MINKYSLWHGLDKLKIDMDLQDTNKQLKVCLGI